MSRTLWPISASAAPRLTAVVVLPTPPFCMATAIVRAKSAPSLTEARRYRPHGGCRKQPGLRDQAGNPRRVFGAHAADLRCCGLRSSLTHDGCARSGARPRLGYRPPGSPNPSPSLPAWPLSLAAVFLIPLIAALVGAAFAVVVGRQYITRRKPYQAIWALALAMFGVAAAFENVGWLGTGSLLLLVPPRAGRAAVIVMTVISLICVVAVLSSHTNPTLLKAQVPPRGAIDVSALLPLITNVGGSLLLVGGAAWSAWKSARAGAPRNRVLGLAILAAGAFIVAGGHSYAQSRGVYVAQPLSEAAGIIAMFGGFLVIEARRELVRSKARTA